MVLDRGAGQEVGRIRDRPSGTAGTAGLAETTVGALHENGSGVSGANRETIDWWTTKSETFKMIAAARNLEAEHNHETSLSISPSQKEIPHRCVSRKTRA